MNTDDVDLARNRVRCIGTALIRTRGMQKDAAQMLGVSPRVLTYMLTVYGLRTLIDIGRLAMRDERSACDLLARFVVDYVPIVDLDARVRVERVR